MSESRTIADQLLAAQLLSPNGGYQGFCSFNPIYDCISLAWPFHRFVCDRYNTAFWRSLAESADEILALLSNNGIAEQKDPAISILDYRDCLSGLEVLNTS